MADLKSHIREVPDFPKPGISFKDITPMLSDPQAFQEVTRQLADPFRGKVDGVVGIESRGFIFGAPVALDLGVGFHLIRKPGKLPSDTHAITYDLEYGSDELQIHTDGVQKGQRVLLIDDLLATGGTMEACCRLLEKAGAEIVGCAFLIHLVALAGERKMEPYRCRSVLSYSGE